MTEPEGDESGKRGLRQEPEGSETHLTSCYPLLPVSSLTMKRESRGDLETVRDAVKVKTPRVRDLPDPPRTTTPEHGRTLVPKDRPELRGRETGTPPVSDPRKTRRGAGRWVPST